MNAPLNSRQSHMSAQLAEAEDQLAAAAAQLTAAAMSITGVLVEGDCRESAKLQALASIIATHTHMVSALTELVRQVPRPELQLCEESECPLARCPYDQE